MSDTNLATSQKYVIKLEIDKYYVISIDWVKQSYKRTKDKTKAFQYINYSEAKKDCDMINEFTLFDKFIIEPA